MSSLLENPPKGAPIVAHTHTTDNDHPRPNGATGPTSPEGKQRSSQNSFRHGLTARDLHVKGDQKDEFNEFKTDLLRQVRPAGAIQMVFFNMMLLSSWNLIVIGRMEADLLNRGADALANPEVRKSLELLHRYQARHERSVLRAKKELEQLQTNEMVRDMLPESVHEATLPMANAMKFHIAKRTADEAWWEDTFAWDAPKRDEVTPEDVDFADANADPGRS